MVVNVNTKKIELPVVDLQDDAVPADWNKNSVEWALKHLYEIKRVIRKQISRFNESFSDTDDLCQETLTYLARHKDYDICSAIEVGRETGRVCDVEGYVKTIAKYVTINYYHNKLHRHVREVPGTRINPDGEEINLLDLIPAENTSFEAVEVDLDSTLVSMQHRRMSMGCDVYLYMFVRLLIMSLGVIDTKSEKIQNLMESLSIKTDENSVMFRDVTGDFFSAIESEVSRVGDGRTGIEEVINKMRKFVYGAPLVESIVRRYIGELVLGVTA